MENASKALIIVGAVLIAILLIGFGVMIMNNSTSQVSPDALNSQAAQTHNAQFNNYTGERLSAQQVKQLMNIITTNNVTGASSDTPQHVFIYVRGNALGQGDGQLNADNYASPSRISSAVRNGFTYRVWIEGTGAQSINEVTGTMNSANTDGGDPNLAYYSNGYIRIISITESR